MTKPHFLIIGDAMLDVWTVGAVYRVCPEAPVPILCEAATTYACGGAANVAANLCALGARVTLIALLGDDEHGIHLDKLCAEAGIDLLSVPVARGWHTTTKHRFVCDDRILLRVDSEIPAREPELTALPADLTQFSGIIVSDYAKGVITPAIADYLRARLKGMPPLFLCLKPVNFAAFSYYLLPTAVILNRSEAQKISSFAHTNPELAWNVRKQFGAKTGVVTLGKDGVQYATDNQNVHVPGHSVKIRSVAGAGDVFGAAFAYYSVCDGSFHPAVFANRTAALSTEHPGTCRLQPCQTTTPPTL